LINCTSYTTAKFRWLRYIAVVITLCDWFQTEYSVYTEYGKIAENQNRDFSFKIKSKSIVWLKSHIVTALAVP